MCVFGVHLGVYGYYIELYCSVIVCFCAHNKLTIFCLKVATQHARTRLFVDERESCLGTVFFLEIFFGAGAFVRFFGEYQIESD